MKIIFISVVIINLLQLSLAGGKKKKLNPSDKLIKKQDKERQICNGVKDIHSLILSKVADAEKSYSKMFLSYFISSNSTTTKELKEKVGQILRDISNSSNEIKQIKFLARILAKKLEEHTCVIPSEINEIIFNYLKKILRHSDE